MKTFNACAILVILISASLLVDTVRAGPTTDPASMEHMPSNVHNWHHGDEDTQAGYSEHQRGAGDDASGNAQAVPDGTNLHNFSDQTAGKNGAGKTVDPNGVSGNRRLLRA